jgi:hypothetical protein
VDEHSESSSIYGMIIDRDILEDLGIIMNFNDQKINCHTGNVPMKPETLIKIPLKKEPQILGH